MRKLATIREIYEIIPHTNADSLEIAKVDGWQVVVRKGEFEQGQLIVYFEIDSWLPTEIAPFLSKGKEPKEYLGVKGERLRSIKLRKELSQGLIMSTDILKSKFYGRVDDDVTLGLGVLKWERPVNANLAGFAKGNFPEFIRKTDQERIQNIFHKLTQEQRDDVYEVTLKMDGSSMTMFQNNGETGVCSRNLELKIAGNENNSFVEMFQQLDIESDLKELGLNIAIQGELYGQGINGNWESLDHHRFEVFDIFDIDKREYLSSESRRIITNKLGLKHVKEYQPRNLHSFNSVEDFLKFAEQPSINNKVAEGFVFKSLTNPEFSFKVVSNSYLLGGGE
jgi:RNA ligase (TIGR02306 family)